MDGCSAVQIFDVPPVGRQRINKKDDEVAETKDKKKDKKKGKGGLSMDEVLKSFSDSPDDFDINQLSELNDDDLKKVLETAVDSGKYLELARRTQAEFENYQKRAQKQRTDDARFAISPLVRELLTSIDNLGRALEAADKTPEFEPLHKGVGMTFKMLEQSLEKFGVKPIDAKGEEFNPEFHDALMTGNEEGEKDNIVLECFEKGWCLHERVIRPAKVRVNKLENQTPQEDSDTDEVGSDESE